jgi:hypothetical protein
MNLPDPEELLKDPKNAYKLFPDRNDQLTVALESMCVAACQPHEKRVERWEAAWEILGPVFIKLNDVGFPGAQILARNKGNVPTAKLPKESLLFKEILKNAGLMDKNEP